MSPSTKTTIRLFVVALVMLASTNRVEGLAGILNRIRNHQPTKSAWGTTVNRGSGSHQGHKVRRFLGSAEESSSLLASSQADGTTTPRFDEDLYRREMTDLVYQRSMERMIHS